MSETAIKTAVGLLHLPANVRRLRVEPIPADIEQLLRILAGDEAAEQEAALACDRPRTTVREAATFYAEQVLLHHDADHYRVLGAFPQASLADLRRNMALLLLWLHPDTNRSEGRSVFVSRVTRAWEDLRTAERRAAYDAAMRDRSELGTNERQDDGTMRSRMPRARGRPQESLLRSGVARLLHLLRSRVAS